MKRYLMALITYVGVGGCATLIYAPDHPYIGRWTWTRADNGCTEIYDNHRDGTSKVVSGSEIGEGRFIVSERIEMPGVYVVVDEITKTNGKEDCSNDGIPAPLGDVVTVYAVISEDGNEMTLCHDKALKSCFGPLRKMRQ